MAKDRIIIFNWDEIGDADPPEYYDKDGKPFILPIDCSDDELVAFLREHHESDQDVPWGVDWLGRPQSYLWRCSSVARTEGGAIIEWRSGRNHLGLTTVIWR
jgi:hypothetical protein